MPLCLGSLQKFFQSFFQDNSVRLYPTLSGAAIEERERKRGKERERKAAQKKEKEKNFLISSLPEFCLVFGNCAEFVIPQCDLCFENVKTPLSAYIVHIANHDYSHQKCFACAFFVPSGFFDVTSGCKLCFLMNLFPSVFDSK